MTTLRDDLGCPLDLENVPCRIVSLVPSLTEALAVTVPDRLVGATDWCTHPADLDVPRVRGTKNPDHATIGRLRPDLVVANQEENRRIDVDRLRDAGIPVWVTQVESVDQALASLRRLLIEVIAAGEPGWLLAASSAWARPPELPAVRVVVPIWRDPWMVVGTRTFSGDVVARLGLTPVPADDGPRYPRLDRSELDALAPDLPAVRLLGKAEALVSGRDLTWYGPSMATSRADLIVRINTTLESCTS